MVASLKRGKRSTPGEVARVKTIRLRVTEEEYAEYMKLAEARKMTLSELIRTGLRLLKIY